MAFTQKTNTGKVTSREDKEKSVHARIRNYKEINRTLVALREEGKEGTIDEVVDTLVTNWENNENKRGDEVL